MGVERRGIMNGRGTKRTHAEQERSPNVPALPETKEPQRNKNKRKKDGKVTVSARVERTQNVATVQLGHGQEIERSGEKADPGGAANRMKQECAGGNAGMQGGSEETQQQWSAEGQVDVPRVVKARNNFGVEHAVGECGNRQNESNERTGSAHVKERTSGANRRTNQNECAEGAHERRKGNKKWIAGADVMMTAGEEMTELMGEQNGEQSEREGQAGSEGGGVSVKKGEGVEKFVERNSLIPRVSDGKLRAGDQTGAKCEKK